MKKTLVFREFFNEVRTFEKGKAYIHKDGDIVLCTENKNGGLVGVRLNKVKPDMPEAHYSEMWNFAGAGGWSEFKGKIELHF